MINRHATLNGYLGRLFALNFLFITAILLGVVYLFDTVELLRRAAKRDVGLSRVLEMGLYKLPEVGQLIFPFAILFGAMFTFWVLTRRSELIVVRAAGFSVWQFLAPVMGVAILIGVLQMAVINPLGAMMLGRYQVLENRYLLPEGNQIALFKEGLWLRQSHHLDSPSTDTSVDEGVDEGYAIIHADKIQLPDWELRGVMVLFFDGDNNFLRRMDATSARLTRGQWNLQDVQISAPGARAERVQHYALPTKLTADEIEESFSSPETLSFWKLPGFIATLKQTGFDATRLSIHFQSLLAQPLLFMAMVLLAATVSLRPPRFRGAMAMVMAGVMMGFVVFFLSSFLQALGASQQIPVLLAAWSPALVTALLGGAVLLTLEDG
ncbi:LPS export ABC transporter permease LptG [Micavibrio aeruginosavorus]|uniref:LPS export ABC transporter permease LptG n=1 Tax=Micavibrio aeruginosavorus TaxID=349221 RepID=UPI003F4AB9B7